MLNTTASYLWSFDNDVSFRGLYFRGITALSVGVIFYGLPSCNESSPLQCVHCCRQCVSQHIGNVAETTAVE